MSYWDGGEKPPHTPIPLDAMLVGAIVAIFMLWIMVSQS